MRLPFLVHVVTAGCAAAALLSAGPAAVAVSAPVLPVECSGTSEIESDGLKDQPTPQTYKGTRSYVCSGGDLLAPTAVESVVDGTANSSCTKLSATTRETLTWPDGTTSEIEIPIEVAIEPGKVDLRVTGTVMKGKYAGAGVTSTIPMPHCGLPAKVAGPAAMTITPTAPVA
ncbi:hypothetical protein ABZ924_21890 [Streptomyces sp. NPDC046876]|uniref:hypothetical protein n=1 Tax=Streptomyces sp. NPDC046876 TaxID=3155616 RepID=UPI0033EFFBCA